MGLLPDLELELGWVVHAHGAVMMAAHTDQKHFVIFFDICVQDTGLKIKFVVKSSGQALLGSGFYYSIPKIAIAEPLKNYAVVHVRLVLTFSFAVIYAIFLAVFETQLIVDKGP